MSTTENPGTGGGGGVIVVPPPPVYVTVNVDTGPIGAAIAGSLAPIAGALGGIKTSLGIIASKISILSSKLDLINESVNSIESDTVIVSEFVTAIRPRVGISERNTDNG